MILYPDPQDYTDPDGSTSGDVSGTWWLPGDAVVRSSVRYWLTGDPLTPDYPAVGWYSLHVFILLLLLFCLFFLSGVEGGWGWAFIICKGSYDLNLTMN